jgi:exodeoxyribonuclease-5
MKLSPQQEEALDLVGRWLKKKDKPFFYLGGFAGTGKTTIAKLLIEGVNNYVCGAYTGKAALVMRNAGLRNAKTIHSLVYKPIPPSKLAYDDLYKKYEATRDYTEKAKLERELVEAQQLRFEVDENSAIKDADLVLLDEVSMVNEIQGADVLSFGKPVLVLGDPGQLPPIHGEGYFTAGDPDYMLTEIHRQAADNPIIKLATMARKGEYIAQGEYGDSLVCHSSQISRGMVKEADQLMCGTNATRRGANMKLRTIMGKQDIQPTAGERLICLKNDGKLGIFNGQMFTVEKIIEDTGHTILMKVLPDGEEDTIEVRALSAFFKEYRYPGTLSKMNFWDLKYGQQFDYAYCITVHKAQGSQFDFPILFDDGFAKRDIETRKQWLYTGITRAAKKLVIGV